MKRKKEESQAERDFSLSRNAGKGGKGWEIEGGGHSKKQKFVQTVNSSATTKLVLEKERVERP